MHHGVISMSALILFSLANCCTSCIRRHCRGWVGLGGVGGGGHKRALHPIMIRVLSRETTLLANRLKLAVDKRQCIYRGGDKTIAMLVCCTDALAAAPARFNLMNINTYLYHNWSIIYKYYHLLHALMYLLFKSCFRYDIISTALLASNGTSVLL